MKERHGHTNHHQHPCACCTLMPRRGFMTTVGLGALTAGSGLLADRAASAGEPAQPTKRPRVRAVFVRPKVDRYWMGWPGTAYDIPARQAQYTKTMTEAANSLGVDLEVTAEPIAESDEMSALVTECAQSPPDGVLITAMSLNEAWDKIEQFITKRPADVPTVVFSPMGTSFLNHVQAMQKAAEGTKTFLASTQEVEWLAFGLRMLHTYWQMKTTRICVVKGGAPKDVELGPVGTALRYIPSTRFSEEYGKVEDGDEVRALAEKWTRSAERIVEPTPQDIIESAKTYVACRRLMAAEGCQGIAVDCLPHVKNNTAPPPCMAFSQLNDEGSVAACQADWPAALSLRLTWLLTGQPGFMQNICVNTANNTLMGSHCTCPLRLEGKDNGPAPLILRTHAESDVGVAPQVLWPEGRDVTILKFSDPLWGAPPEAAETAAGSVLLGSGHVIRNIDTPPSGGCRTSLEVAVDGVEDVRSLKHLHHQVFILGSHKQKLRSYCELSGIDVTSV